MIFIFDIDGTLTPPRQFMENPYVFANWAKDKTVFLITGSDYTKVKEQIPLYLRLQVNAIYACLGNEEWRKDYLYKYKDYSFPHELYEHLKHFLKSSLCTLKTGKHFEYRRGMLNFSTIGRNANLGQREEYAEWDEIRGERKQIVSDLSGKFPDFDFSIGGQISIDITPKGWNKGQIYDYLASFNEPITFYGDKTQEGGNDYPLAEKLLDGGHRVIQTDYRFNGVERGEVRICG